MEALLDRIESGADPVDFDGLRAGTDDAGYALEIPERDVGHRGLDESAFREIARGDEAAPYVTNWHYWEVAVGRRGRHRRAFLRHAEAADERSVPRRYAELRSGVRTEWGQVVVTATLGEHGARRYELRHVDDVGADPDDLDDYEDPLDAREIATEDDRGRYRPLKTAPTLVPGWRFPDLDGRDAVGALDVFYPASVANWNLEREGELDVTHWRETAERQTGIYDVVEDLPPEAVEWMAEACCVDSQCLKRREWEYDESRELGVDGGAGPFPCREPCSLVVAAARKWTRLEAEETRTYEFDLTPSEREQIEEIVDAVADGRVDEIREADVGEGANRYRARYLRAKRFDGDRSGD
ncbi:DR2241 family protein [Halobellus sp. GM3]|uniref:DR2241 family protein n=1 Tax=Halobellus sp. GM3 TaxID=3458410 RepID=UPI00403E173D